LTNYWAQVQNKDAGSILGESGLACQLKKQLGERMLAAELNHGLQVSPDLISTITDEVLAEARQWQMRPLEAMYPIVYFDALRLKIRDEGTVRSNIK
jgi:transposase-like protein